MSVPELGYRVTDKPYPRGEVLLRGPGIFKGYFRQEDRTAEAVDEQGWLHTGDIGMVVERGALRLIDSKKNIIKLSQGEHSAPEKVERVLEIASIISCFGKGASTRSKENGADCLPTSTKTMAMQSGEW